MSIASRFLHSFIPRAAVGLVRVLRRLMRWRIAGAEVVHDLHRRGQPYILAFFHDQLLMMTYAYPGAGYGRRIAALASRHRDGRYIATTLERFGHVTVAGSTGRGGVAGLREMVRQLRAGLDLGFAVDGPRGPRHRVQAGVVEAARLGGAPIVPVAFAASKKKLCAPGIASRSRCRSGAAPSSTVTRSSSRRTPIAA